jgi:CelD/BcsL family acetyltransferase involved in cellulose biosynthesis
MRIEIKQSASVKVIREWDDFKVLKVAWEKLLKQSDADNIFLTWEWINCWRKTQKKSIKPLILVILNDEKIIAIAPFYIQTYRLVNFIPYQALRILGDQGSGSEYANFIVEAADSLALKRMLWQLLLSTAVKPIWDFIWFTNISAWTEGGDSLLQALAAEKKLNYNQRTVEFAQTSLTTLTADILPSLSKSLRTNIRQTSRRLDKLGPWHIDMCDNHSRITEHIETLFSLHNKHWIDAGLGTFERRPELADFYRAFVPIALQKGCLRLLRLESNGETQAMQLGYVYNNEFFAIQEGYNPDFLGGTGQVLRHYSFLNCRSEGLKCYDFLGGYTDHKRRWLADKKLGANLFIWHNKPKNILFSFKKIWPTGRYLKPLSK